MLEFQQLPTQHLDVSGYYVQMASTQKTSENEVEKRNFRYRKIVPKG